VVLFFVGGKGGRGQEGLLGLRRNPTREKGPKKGGGEITAFLCRSAKDLFGIGLRLRILLPGRLYSPGVPSLLRGVRNYVKKGV